MVYSHQELIPINTHWFFWELKNEIIKIKCVLVDVAFISNDIKSYKINIFFTAVAGQLKFFMGITKCMTLVGQNS